MSRSRTMNNVGLMRTHTRGLMVVVTASSLFFINGCSGESGSDNVDATVQADGCVGQACPCSCPVTSMNEVGLLRVERFHRGNNPDGSRIDEVGAWMYLFNAQMPAMRSVTGPRMDFAGNENITCFDQTEHNTLMAGYSIEHQAIADTRSYYDVGDAIPLLAEDGSVSMTMVEMREQADPVDHMVHDVIYLAQPSTENVWHTEYQFPSLLPQSETGFPGLVWNEGFDVPGQSDYVGGGTFDVPPNFSLIQPTEDAFYAETGLLIDRTGDLTFEWSIDPEYPLPNDAPIATQFTAFANVDAEQRTTIEYLCLGAAANGTYTIPGALFDAPGFPEQGVILHGMFFHISWENPGFSPDQSDDSCCSNDTSSYLHHQAFNTNVGRYRLDR